MKRLTELDALRGVAALAVLYYHATNTVDNYPSSPLLRLSGLYGDRGVEIFFVISGFIIPHSMWMSGYRLRQHLGQFMAKRLLRVEPAYLVSLAFAVLAGLLVNSLYGRSIYSYSIAQIGSHLLYLSDFLGFSWANPVYWSLAVEFQFYLLIAILFPVLATTAGYCVLLGCTLAIYVTVPLQARTLLAAAPFFVMGIVCALERDGKMTRRWSLFSIVFIFAVVLAKFEFASAAAGLLTACVILYRFPLPGEQVLAAVGLLSYSLYLFHYPIVEKLVRIGKQVGSSVPMQVLVLAVACAASLLAAWMAYRLVESPSLRAAGRIRYRGGFRTSRAAAETGTRR